MNSGYGANAGGGWKSAGNKTRSDGMADEEEGRPSSRGARQPSALNTNAPSPAFIPPSTTASSPSTYRRASIYPSSPSYGDLNNPTAPPMFDPRETNSVRDNITQLVNKNTSSNGGNSATSGENQPRGLAGLMGGTNKPPRLHRAGTGPTVDEREITERLEREMEISKAKWSGKLESRTKDVVGVSMASVMQGRANNGGSTTGGTEKQRWAVRGTPAKVDSQHSVLVGPRPVQSAVPVAVSPAATPALPSIAVTTKTATVFTRAPPASTTTPSIPFPSSTRSISPTTTINLVAPTSTNSLTTKPTTSPSSLAFPSTPLSLATALGSTSNGPRLNKPSPSPSSATPTQSFPFPSPTPVASQSPVALPGLSRTPSSVRERARSLATLGGQEWALKEVVQVRSHTRQTEGIVADRLKSVESPRGSPRGSGASVGMSDSGVGVGESPSKKRSVLERWNRDEADQKDGASPSPTKKIEGRWSGRSQSVDVRDNPTLRTFDRPSTTSTTLPAPPIFSTAVSPTISPSTSKSQLLPPRSVSAQGQSSPKLSASDHSPPRGVRGDPSPRFDSPPMDDSTWGDLGSHSSSSTTTSPTLLKSTMSYSAVGGGGRVGPGTGWTAPPIGVKEYKKPGIFSSSSTSAASKEAMGLGIEGEKEKVALPGMIVPSKRPLNVGVEGEKTTMDEDTPRPWSPSKRPTNTSTPSYTRSTPIPIPTTRQTKEEIISRSISGAKLDEILASAESPPRSSVKNAIATWGTPSRSTSTGSINGLASGNGLVLGVTYPTPQRVRKISQQDSSMPTRAKLIGGSTREWEQDKTIQMFSFTPAGITHPSLDTDISLLYDTESILLFDPVSKVAYLWTGRENSLETNEVDRRIAEVTHGAKEVVRCIQGAESREFVELIGGRLVVRQGSREAFDVNDSRFYRVAYEQDGLLFIDEDNLSIDSLCSKNCAVITLLGQINLWIGRGSTALERRAALDFAKQIAGDRRITSYEELNESEEFWSILDGDQEEYANAHHWLYRPTSSTPYAPPKIYTLDTTSRPILNTDSEPLSIDSLHILQTEMEYLLLIPSALKADTNLIERGIKSLQSLTTSNKIPQVQGILLFPCVIPIDIRRGSRGLMGRLRELNGDEMGRVMDFWTVEDWRAEFLGVE